MPNNDIDISPITDYFDSVLFGEADGYDGEGNDSDGYNRAGFKEADDGVMRDRDGYDEAGFRYDTWGELRDRDGYDEEGYDSDGYDRYGYDSNGFNRNGRDSDGYDEDGYDADGFNRDGYDTNGYDEDGYDADGFNRDGYDEDGYDEDGYDENGDYRSGDGEANWLYGNEPRLRFHSLRSEKDAAAERGVYTSGKRLPDVPYYGMEIELSSDCNSEVRRIIQQTYGDIVWAKPDCSVRGFEMCSHPMTAAWAQEKFPWNIVDELDTEGCHVMPESNGLHIHVSRSGFTDWTHQLRWVKQFYRMKDQITGPEGMAGRYAGEWGAFSNRGNQFNVFRRDLAAAHGKRINLNDYLPRYLACNLQNKHTIEVRTFASTTDPETLRMRFELVAASVEYTRNLTVREINDGGWEYEPFVQWLIKNEGAYPALERRVVPALTLA